MATSHADIIDYLTGISPGDRIDALRQARPVARDNAEASFRALFQPKDHQAVSLVERFAIAAYVAAVHGPGTAADFYAGELNTLHSKIGETVLREAKLAASEGPFGNYPDGPLSRENTPGTVYRISAAGRAFLGERLAAGLDHAHLLVFHPRDAAPEDHQRLFDAGWTTTGIVTLSQIIAFLTFQLRVAHGLAELARTGQKGTQS